MSKRRYGQFCPVAYSLDLLGERWTVLIVRNLCTGPKRFTDLRNDLVGIAPNLLSDRLRTLTDEGVVETRELPPPAARTVYQLTERGRAFAPVLHELARWGLDLLGLPSPDEVLPAGLVADGLRAMVLLEELPDDGITVGFEIDEGPHTMVVRPRPEAGSRGPLLDRVVVGPADTPAAAADVTVTSSLPALLWLRTGAATPAELAEQGLLTLRGTGTAVRTFAHLWSVDPSALGAVTI